VSESGSITADKLEGPMAGKQLSDLATAMSNGDNMSIFILNKTQMEKSAVK